MHLKALVDGIAAGNLGNDWDSLAAGYVERGWVVDASAWRAYAMVRDAPDLEAVTAALRAVYQPWLESLAEQVQGWAASYPMAAPAGSPVLEPTPGTVLVFVDGLRCDLGMELDRLLTQYGLSVEIATRWSALPTVTATAKPAWRPLADGLVGSTLPEGFEPQIAQTGKDLKTQAFRNLLANLGWDWLEPTSTGDPNGTTWTEIGTFDHDGHTQGARLAWRMEEELEAVASAGAGPAPHRLETRGVDHGPRLAAPPRRTAQGRIAGHLTQSRWPRCAVPQPGAHHGFKELPWFWGGGHSVVFAPGVSAFKTGVEYAHGGLSPQEALTPILTVTAGQQTVQSVAIASAEWKGLRLRVKLKGGFAGTVLDIRTKAADKHSSVLDTDRRMKPPDAEGSAALLVTDDEKEGTAAVLVVIRDGQVVAKRPVTVGGD